MARNHTIFIGALFHVAIAVFKSDSPTLDNMILASYLELLSSTSQLPAAAARTWQCTPQDRRGLGFKRLAIDVSICTSNLLFISFMGRSCCFFSFIFPIETKGVRLDLYICTFAGQDSPRFPEE